ncbi:MAG: hypothetical protein GC154_07025 [bacterium]|nr:hypothetical protein [bacterium]
MANDILISRRQAVRASSVIGPGTELEGTLHSEGDVLIEGAFTGDLHVLNHLTIREPGKVSGSIEAGEASIEGHTHGPILASERVILHASSQVQSDVAAPRIVVEPGARVKGRFCITPDEEERRRFQGKPASKSARSEDGKRDVRFTGEFSGVKTVALLGDFNGWDEKASIPFHASGNGTWSLRLKLPPGRYEYLFLVDGEPRPDPGNQQRVKNEFGGENSVLVVE